jgi:uncharacterized protein (TIGR00106 family)
MAIMEVSVLPIGTCKPSIGENVTRALRELQNEGDIAYQPTSMGTVIEGDLDKLLGLVRRMHESAFDEETKRVHTTIRIDDRRDKPSKMFMPI